MIGIRLKIYEMEVCPMPTPAITIAGAVTYTVEYNKWRNRRAFITEWIRIQTKFLSTGYGDRNYAVTPALERNDINWLLS